MPRSIWLTRRRCSDLPAREGSARHALHCAKALGQNLVGLAENGDIAAIRICMERLAPAGKDEPVDIGLPPIEKPSDSVAAAQAIVAAVAAGDLTATEAAGLAKVVDIYVRA